MAINLTDYEDVASLNKWFQGNFPMGSLKQIGETLEVQDDFELLCWDFVSTPSNPGSFMSTINEGMSSPINPYSKVNSIVTEILCANGSCPIF